VFVGSCKGCPGSAAREAADAGGVLTAGVLLVISKTDIVVGDDPSPVVLLPARETPARSIPDPPVLPPLADVRGPEGKLALAVFVVNGGYSMKTAAGNIAPGCAGLGAGLTLPKRGADHDLGGLASCARRIKGRSTDTEVTAADPGTDFATIVDTMDALEGVHKDLFPVVHFGVVR
jgi:hypothetical protein